MMPSRYNKSIGIRANERKRAQEEEVARERERVKEAVKEWAASVRERERESGRCRGNICRRSRWRRSGDLLLRKYSERLISLLLPTISVQELTGARTTY